MIATKLFSVALVPGLVLPGAAFAARSDWSPASESQMRLLLMTAPDGTIDGGVEIVLEPGWYTYWRNPGEAGVPPIFDFSGSQNVANVDVLYPAPLRHDADGSISLIYQDEVVFPLAVTPVEAEAPVTLRVSANYGVCSAICIPTGASSEVTLSADAEADPLSAARIEEFQERVPQQPETGRFDIERVSVADDALTIDVRMPDSSYSDLFAEPPAGWYIGQPAFLERVDGVSRYRLSVAGRPADSKLQGQRFRFVAVAGGAAIEEVIEIP
jgi:DsbC/DsbD-like thiol-disulfide interchange protein